MPHLRMVRSLTAFLGILLFITACGGAEDADTGTADTADTADDTAVDEPEETEAESAETGDGTEDGAASSADDDGAGEPLEIDLGISVSRPDADLFPYTAAAALGYFEEENLTVNVVPTGGSGDLIEQLVTGNIQVGTPNMLTLVRAMGTGEIGLQNYYTIAYGTNFGVFVPEGSDVQEIADLEGLTIGVTEPGGGEFAVLLAALGDADLTLDDVTTIPIGAGDAATLNAIETGQVDAYAAALQDVFALRLAGLELSEVTPDLFGDNPQRGLIVSPSTLAEDEEALIRLARAWAKATLFCETNREACAEFQREADSETWSENDEGLSIGGLQYDGSFPNISTPDDEQYGRHYNEAYEELMDEFERTLEEFEPVSVEDFLVPDLLDAINDFDRDAVIAEAEAFGG